MANVLKTKVIRIGNSRGVRIPKPLLLSAGIDEDIEIVQQDGSLLIRPSVHPRAGWAEQFELMHQLGEDKLLEGDEWIENKFDEEEWVW
jgi:antitoxin MazE